LFNDVLVAQCEILALSLNGDLERLWYEVVVAYFEVVSHVLPGGTEEYHKNPV
jgi:hypothetical protein